MRLTVPLLRSRALLASPVQITSLMHQTAHASRCPCHACTSASPAQAQQSLLTGLRRMGSNVVEKEYAFEVRLTLALIAGCVSEAVSRDGRGRRCRPARVARRGRVRC
jgi:hypothetical protein